MSAPEKSFRMKRFAASVVLAATGMLQGACLILMGASSLSLKSPQMAALRDDQYGSLFVVMVISAIFASALTQTWVQKWGRPLVYTAGVLFFWGYLIFLYGLALTPGLQMPSYFLLLSANACLGLGFGILCALMNALIVEWYPSNPNIAVTALHSFFGVGAGLSPLLVGYCVLHWDWFAVLNILVSTCFVVSLASLSVPFLDTPTDLHVEEQMQGNFIQALIQMDAHGRHFLVAILIYGIAESMLGNWSLSYLNEVKGVSLETASTALALFWSFLTVGRMLTSLMMFKFAPRVFYRLLPFAMTVVLFLLVVINDAGVFPWLYIATGLSFSSFFPLSVGLAAESCHRWRSWVSALSVSALMVGVGIGSFAPGLFRENGWLTLSQSYLGAAGFSLVLFFLAWRLTKIKFIK